MSLGNHAEDLLLTYLLTISSSTRPTAWFVSLHTADPGDDGANNEVAVGTDADYVRKAATFDDPVVDSGQVLSSNAPSWTVNSGSSGYTVTHICIFDAVTAGNCLFSGQLLVSKPLIANGVLTFTAGDIVATLD